MFKDVSVPELLALQEKGKVITVDVRSPSEFKRDTIPGSLNIPLFNDEERAEIGTLYKKVGVDAAKKKGLEVVSAKLPSFINTFGSGEEKGFVVFCWRGGMRSKTSATVLDLMGLPVYRLQGGVRAYRQWVVKSLERLELKAEAIVLNGSTGSGKTSILRELKAEGIPVIDLEKMANHRGSIFGQIGLEPNNQKFFDSQFLQEALQLSSRYFLMEAESKRIGKVMLPESIIRKKEEGIQLFIDIPIEARVQNILDEYRPWEHQQKFIEAFQRIKRRIHTPAATQIENDLKFGRFESAVTLLLQYYYDPRYRHKEKHFPQNRRITLHVENSEAALDEIRSMLQNRKRTIKNGGNESTIVEKQRIVGGNEL
ncbi:tRNA 2-selenouridine(34) synthase MnmH [Falsibacillus albus]|uniref:tRNA 2-selenouridine(34) synthase MnmH n=1 Tax=Falsibacillus albus TaxID=2478915 RepID=A0A3L7K2U7_9BACI|nr:tRNA 2-selenouridine(34) synthase MnmH [Falsibacillus albus]RLQ96311.1 tRNA 2-selenouridine(34) synthase MnmH [Falsibacillus albus]